MTDITLLDVHEAELRERLATSDGSEASAYILFGRVSIERDPWSGQARQKFVSRRVVSIPDEDRISSSPVHVTWSTRSFVRLLKQAEADGLVAGIVHTHPGSNAFFSEQDDRNEMDLLQIVRNRSGDGHGFVSLVLGGDGSARARHWTTPETAVTCEHLFVAGRRLVMHGRIGTTEVDESLDRQARLFGANFNPVVRKLRVGVVGCGGTGSPTALLLARLGIGRLLLIDDDVVEMTNLNRIHGSRRSDIDDRMAKVDVIAREIEMAGLGTRVATHRGWVGDKAVRDAVRSCDVIFGCTDDHDGRLFLNRLSYFYGIPVLDMGLRMVPARDDRPYEMAGRVTLVAPDAPCLLCRGHVDPRLAAEEALKRTDPVEYESRKAEAYVLGGGDPAPAVVTFTTSTACMAVDELLQGITGFRGDAGMKTERRRSFDTMLDRSTTCSPRAECEICSRPDVWGLGDVEPFLHRMG